MGVFFWFRVVKIRVVDFVQYFLSYVFFLGVSYILCKYGRLYIYFKCKIFQVYDVDLENKLIFEWQQRVIVEGYGVRMFVLRFRLLFFVCVILGDLLDYFWFEMFLYREQ